MEFDIYSKHSSYILFVSVYKIEEWQCAVFASFLALFYIVDNNSWKDNFDDGCLNIVGVLNKSARLNKSNSDGGISYERFEGSYDNIPL